MVESVKAPKSVVNLFPLERPLEKEAYISYVLQTVEKYQVLDLDQLLDQAEEEAFQDPEPEEGVLSHLAKTGLSGLTEIMSQMAQWNQGGKEDCSSEEEEPDEQERFIPESEVPQQDPNAPEDLTKGRALITPERFSSFVEETLSEVNPYNNSTISISALQLLINRLLQEGLLAPRLRLSLDHLLKGEYCQMSELTASQYQRFLKSLLEHYCGV